MRDEKPAPVQHSVQGFDGCGGGDRPRALENEKTSCAIFAICTRRPLIFRCSGSVSAPATIETLNRMLDGCRLQFASFAESVPRTEQSWDGRAPGVRPTFGSRFRLVRVWRPTQSIGKSEDVVCNFRNLHTTSSYFLMLWVGLHSRTYRNLEPNVGRMPGARPSQDCSVRGTIFADARRKAGTRPTFGSRFRWARGWRQTQSIRK